MNNKVINFINQVCLSEGLSQNEKENRVYSVLMYLVNVEKRITAEGARDVMDKVKSGVKLLMDEVV